MQGIIGVNAREGIWSVEQALEMSDFRADERVKNEL